LVHAEVGGYLRTFVDAGPALAAALSRACDQLAREPEPKPGIGIRAYAHRVLAACQAGWPAWDSAMASATSAAAPKQVTSERQAPHKAQSHGMSAGTEPRLSPRERDLLDCIMAGMSNKEIARQLALSTATVKWYLAQLYEKLDVCSRTQALACARDLGLMR